ncbi:Protein toll [Mizuhopecten yessoensis]|uniref:Protein toll n=2 Tax=Mizuhopecten yessoensis TaxID=6573 RepID=A0A210QY26_MIZYE|nr:Protein toll [Mizuhopecten yessoensis]
MFGSVLSSRDADVCGIPACMNKTSLLPPITMFSLHGNNVPFKGMAYLLQPPRGMHCYINLTTILHNYNFTQEPAVAILAIHCQRPFIIHMSEFVGDSLNHIWYYFQMQGCRTTYRSLNRLSTAVDLKTITLPSKAYIHTNGSDCLSSNKSIPECHAIYNVQSIWITHSYGYPEQDLVDLFRCADVFPNMTELTVTNMSLTELPPSIIRKIPNVQSLEISNCQLTLPPKDFPWTEQSVRLTGNLTMEQYFLEHYAKPFNIELDPNLYRRILNLNFNRISNLSNFLFKGHLQMIRLSGNGMIEIGSLTFRHLVGIQHIDVSLNKLRSVPEGLFLGLTSLRHIDLSSNDLESLPTKLFKDVTNVVHLNLANNSLEHLPNGVFSTLSHLQEIHLEHNKLVTIEAKSFLITSSTLTMLYFDSNPLRVVPDIVFYLRYLNTAYIRNTFISFNNLTEITSRVNWSRLTDAVIKSTSSANLDLNKPADTLRKVDLTGSAITTFWIQPNLTEFQHTFLLLLLRHFHFILDNNRITCDCNIITFSKWIHKLKRDGLLTGTEYFFTEWICMYPYELRGRRLLNVKPEETYCVTNVTNCPAECWCYKRSVSEVIIVDCRDRSLEALPSVLPDGRLDLWFHRNNISILENKAYLSRVRQLVLSYNNLEVIESSAISSLKNVMLFYLDSNLLAILPAQFRDMKTPLIMLKNNPFRCDCNTLWMKSWILNHQSRIPDWTEISCNSQNDDGKQFVSLPDKEFICVEDFDSVKHVITPVVSSSLSLAVFLVALGLLYIYRLEVKVLLYIYCGIHPFDKDKKGGKEKIDAVVIHGPGVTDWVMKNIVTYLEENAQHYVICEINRDFVAGFSYQENIVSIVRRSKRMILILSDEMTDTHDMFKVAWREAQLKIKEKRTNYVIVIGHNTPRKKLTNKELKRYLKRGRFVHTGEALLREKILYSMPNYKYTADNGGVRGLPNIRKCIQNTYDTDDKGEDEIQFDAFLAYGDTDRKFAVNALRADLEKNGYTLIIPDRDFPPGASKEENILEAVSRCHHTLFILSGEHLEDEWSLFTFRSAIEKSLRNKSNHLILLSALKEDMIIVDEEVKYHMKTQVGLDINSPWFWERLHKALPRKGEGQSQQIFLEDEKNVEELERIKLLKEKEKEEKEKEMERMKMFKEDADENEGKVKETERLKRKNGDSFLLHEKDIYNNEITDIDIKQIEGHESLLFRAKLKEIDIENEQEEGGGVPKEIKQKSSLQVTYV